MLPIRDVNPTRIRPWVTWVIIGACVVVYFGFQNYDSTSAELEFLYRRAAIACEITTGQPLSTSELANPWFCVAGDASPVIFPEKLVYLAVFTSMFLHGGLGHLLFNMWSLWIFGNNVEEAFGHFWYALFYVAGGVVASLVFVVMNPGSTVPLVGASGAIAAALGAYAVLFPGHRVLTLLGWILLPLPAFIFLGFWFFAQFGLGGTNTAWEAHVGGFIFGLVVAFVFRRRLLFRVATGR